MKLHHVQISMPRGQEAEARRFYTEALGLVEVPKPEALADRGGCWFRAYSHNATSQNTVTAEIHVGADEPFQPAAKAHPGLLCDSLPELESMAERIQNLGYEVSWAERVTFAGYLRFHARDGFGNRLEIMTLAEAVVPAEQVVPTDRTVPTEQTQPCYTAQCDQCVPQDVARLLETLPEWFGQPESNAEYGLAAHQKESWTVRDAQGQVIAVALLDRHFPHAWEIHLMLVDRAHHGQGAGTALFAAIQADALAGGVKLLQVKTLGASHPDPGYAKTRHFYLKQGFMPLEESDAWGLGTPCLSMVKVLSAP